MLHNRQTCTSCLEWKAELKLTCDKTWMFEVTFGRWESDAPQLLVANATTVLQKQTDPDQIHLPKLVFHLLSYKDRREDVFLLFYASQALNKYQCPMKEKHFALSCDANSLSVWVTQSPTVWRALSVYTIIIHFCPQLCLSWLLPRLTFPPP